MAGIHFKKSLIHSAMVQRSTPTRSASGEMLDSWVDVDTINCRYVEKSERIAAEGIGFMMLESRLLLCDAGEDVKVDDQIVDVTLRSDDSVVDAGPFTVETFLKRSGAAPHHISLKLERVE